MMSLWLQPKGRTFSPRRREYIQMAVRGQRAGKCVLHLQDVTKNYNFSEGGDEAYVGDEIIKTGNWVPIMKMGSIPSRKQQ